MSHSGSRGSATRQSLRAGVATAAAAAAEVATAAAAAAAAEEVEAAKVAAASGGGGRRRRKQQQPQQQRAYVEARMTHPTSTNLQTKTKVEVMKGSPTVN